MQAKLILRLFQSLQGILQTSDFYRHGLKKEIGVGDEWDVHFMHRVILSSISEKLVREQNLR